MMFYLGQRYLLDMSDVTIGGRRRSSCFQSFYFHIAKIKELDDPWRIQDTEKLDVDGSFGKPLLAKLMEARQFGKTAA